MMTSFSSFRHIFVGEGRWWGSWRVVSSLTVIDGSQRFECWTTNRRLSFLSMSNFRKATQYIWTARGNTWSATLIPLGAARIKGCNSFLIFGFAALSEKRRSSRQTESKTKTQTAAWEVEQRSVCVCRKRFLSVCVHACFCFTSLHCCLLWLPDPWFRSITTWTALRLDFFVGCTHDGTHIYTQTQHTDLFIAVKV